MDMNERMKDAEEVIKGSAILVVVTALGFILNGWAVSLLWEWFIATKFGIPSISIAHGVGLTILVTMLTYQTPIRPKTTREAEDAMKVALVVYFAKPLLCLALGFLVHLLV